MGYRTRVPRPEHIKADEEEKIVHFIIGVRADSDKPRKLRLIKDVPGQVGYLHYVVCQDCYK
jgi:hypothetical protein